MAERIVATGLLKDGQVIAAREIVIQKCDSCKLNPECVPKSGVNFVENDEGKKWVLKVRGRHVGEIGCAIALPRVN